MKKKIFITFLLLSAFLFQGCIKEVTQRILEGYNNVEKYRFYDLDAKKWIDVTPKKEIYKVGDTVTITYKIPSRIGKYTTSDSSTTSYLRESFNKDHKDFDIYEDTKQKGLVSNGLQEIYCRSKINSCKGYSNKKDLIVLLNGKEINGTYPNFNTRDYVYNPKTEEYILELKLTFLNPNDFYWKTTFSLVPNTPNALSLIPEVENKLVNIKHKYVYSNLFIKYTESEKISFNEFLNLSIFLMVSHNFTQSLSFFKSPSKS